ncbi:MAG: TonB-dependent receptor domain-containing protein [Bryobacteraceae bacterium]
MSRPIAVLLLLAATLGAQDFRASISGRVTDPSGAVVAGAQVTVANTSTRVSSQTQTNDQGVYSIPYLIPGPYEVRVEARGFKTAVRQGVTLQVSDRLTLDIALEVGGATERVEVREQAPLIDTTAAVGGTVISNTTVTRTPSITRIPYLLAGLSPGVIVRDMDGTLPNPAANGTSSGLRVNGGVGDASNEFLIDGSPNETTTRVAYIPSADAIQEFKVVANAYDAQYGRQGGATINVTTRAGTNEYHGGVYHFHRNSSMGVNTFQSNLTGRAKDLWHFNMWGGQLGGPINIPKVYKGRDRTFFFFNYEGMLDTEPRFSIRSVPTADQRNGDFSTSTAISGGRRVPLTIYDPLTTDPATGARQAFPGNRIPASRINPISQKVYSFVAQPNLAEDPALATGVNNFVPNTPAVDTIDSAVTRLDHQFSPRHKVFATLRWNHWEESIGNVFKNPATGSLATRVNRGAGLDDVFVFNPSTVLNVRYGLTRWESPSVSDGFGFDPALLGFSPAVVSMLPVKAFPSFSIAGGLGGTPSSYTITNNHSLTGAVTHVKGGHTLNIGAQFMVLQTASFSSGAGAGSYSFSTGFTQRDYQRSDGISGSADASFLLGFPSSGSVSVNASGMYSQRYTAFYAQDDWRVSPKLTLSLGLRWDFESPFRERFNRANRGFDTVTPSPVEAAVLANYAKSPIPELPAGAFRVRGGQLFAGAGGQPSRIFATDYRAWQPRVGMAYRLTPKTAIRSGFGIFTMRTTGTGGQNGFSIDTPYVSSNDGGRTPAGSLNSPFPAGLLAAAGASRGLETSLGQAPRWDEANRRLPFSVQWSFHVQRELSGGLLLEAGYAYNKSKRLGMSVPANQVPLASWLELGKARYDASGRLLAQPFRLEDRVASPFYGLPQFAGTGLGTGSTIAISSLLLPYPQFSGFSRGGVDSGRSTYNSFQFKIEKRFSETLSLLASYTLSKQFDDSSYLNSIAYQVEHALNAEDRPHHFSLAGSYVIPVGRGRRLLTDANRFVNAVIGGWEMAGNYNLQSGKPVSFGTNLTWNGQDATIARTSRTLDKWFKTANFGIIPKEQTYTLRTTPTTFAHIRGSRVNNLDFAILKNFRPIERLNAQFRLESFNALNHPRFGAPNTNPAGSSFGTVSKSQLNQPRILQVALKLNF